MSIEVVFDVILKKLRMKDPTAPADSLWDELNGNIYRLINNVGIGTDTPTEKLEVVGNIKATSVETSGTLSGDIGYGFIKPVALDAWALIVKRADNDFIFGIRGTSGNNVQMKTGNSPDINNLVNSIVMLTSGKVGILASPSGAEFHVHGYSKLGDTSTPAIKMKFIEDTIESEAGTTSIAHGLIKTLIISVSVLVIASGSNNKIMPNTEVVGMNYSLNISTVNINIETGAAAGGNILGQTVEILIIYRDA